MIPLIIAGVSAGFSIYNSIKSAEAQAEAAEQNAQIKTMQANEILARQRINAGIMREKADRMGSDYVAAQGSSGLVGAGVGGAIRVKRETEQNIALERRDAEFKAKMTMLEAQNYNDQAADSRNAGYWQAGSTLLGAASSAVSPYKPGGTQGLWGG
jgi:hypothetical protein